MAGGGCRQKVIPKGEEEIAGNSIRETSREKRHMEVSRCERYTKAMRNMSGRKHPPMHRPNRLRCRNGNGERERERGEREREGEEGGIFEMPSWHVFRGEIP